MSRPEPPPGWQPPASGPPTRRGRGLVIAGGVMIALAIIGVVVTLLLGVGGVAGAAASLQRVPAASGGTVRIDEPGTYAVFVEGATGTALTAADLEVTGPDGQSRPVTPAGGVTYELEGVDGAQVGTVLLDVAGAYRIEPVATARGGGLAIAPEGLVGGLVGGILLLVLGILGCVLVGIVGIVLLIVGLVRRSRSRQAPPGWGR